MLNQILSNAPLFLLVYARCFTMLLTMPMFSMRSVSRLVKVALAGYMAFFIYGTGNFISYAEYLNSFDGVFSLVFILILVGEALIGVILGFYVNIIFAAFSSAGQFTAFQMGFSAASTYDALAQVENPLLGQFFNFIALLVFMRTYWFQKLFLGALANSFESISVFGLIEGYENLISFLLKGLTKLFENAMVISLPVMGILLLITVSTGLLSKAAPQMNLLSEGFPIMILVAFLIIFLLGPDLVDFFARSFNSGFNSLQNLFISFSGGK